MHTYIHILYMHVSHVTPTQINSKNDTMEFTDFLEGLARIAFEVYPPVLMLRFVDIGVLALLNVCFIFIPTRVSCWVSPWRYLCFGRAIAVAKENIDSCSFSLHWCFNARMSLVFYDTFTTLEKCIFDLRNGSLKKGKPSLLTSCSNHISPQHIIERPLAVSVGRLLAHHFVELCTEHGKPGVWAPPAPKSPHYCTHLEVELSEAVCVWVGEWIYVYVCITHCLLLTISHTWFTWPRTSATSLPCTLCVGMRVWE